MSPEGSDSERHAYRRQPRAAASARQPASSSSAFGQRRPGDDHMHPSSASLSAAGQPARRPAGRASSAPRVRRRLFNAQDTSSHRAAHGRLDPGLVDPPARLVDAPVPSSSDEQGRFEADSESGSASFLPASAESSAGPTAEVPEATSLRLRARLWARHRTPAKQLLPPADPSQPAVDPNLHHLQHALPRDGEGGAQRPKMARGVSLLAGFGSPTAAARGPEPRRIAPVQPPALPQSSRPSSGQSSMLHALTASAAQRAVQGTGPDARTGSGGRSSQGVAGRHSSVAEDSASTRAPPSALGVLVSSSMSGEQARAALRSGAGAGAGDGAGAEAEGSQSQGNGAATPTAGRRGWASILGLVPPDPAGPAHAPARPAAQLASPPANDAPVDAAPS